MARRRAVSVDDVFGGDVLTTNRQSDIATKQQDDVEKLTVYVPVSLRAELDIARAQLRSQHSVRTTYSEIVSVAVEQILGDKAKLAALLLAH